MGSGKWFFLAGVATGALGILRLSEQQITGAKGLVARISQSDSLSEAKRVAKDKVNSALRAHGASLVDRIAEEIKKQLYVGEPTDKNTSGETLTTTPEESDTDKPGNNHQIIIDGKIVS